MLLGVDVGGTFTDAVLVDAGRLITAKAPTTPADQSEGVLDAVGRVLALADRRPAEVSDFAHGMTVTTNALLEGRFARTALVATRGFTDIVELGRQARPHLYRLCDAHPAPVAPAQLRFAAPERTGPEGTLEALDEERAVAMVAALAASEPEAVAVVLLHAYAHPAHELAVGRLIAQRLPTVHVSLSHQVVGTFREYERAATTELDAGLSVSLTGYLTRLAHRAQALGLPLPAIMQSSGGLADLDQATRHPAVTVLSGPAAGAAGASLLARHCGVDDVLGLDMGGTSCDVSVIEDGAIRDSTGRTVAGRPLALPMVDVHTVGAGGGSIAWRDAGGALRVGPRSAGADPGPACYDHGGHEPTVTDANLLLGYLDARSQLAGQITLSVTRARQAVGRLAEALGLDIRQTAAGIVRVANAEMVGALRVMTVARGVDPRRYALLAFGGAGPLHAAALADELGIERIICPAACGVLSALGLAAAERRADAQRSVLLAESALTRQTIAADVAALTEEARRRLSRPGLDRRVEFDVRYRGQSHELTVAGLAEPSPAALRRAFETRHRERYGYSDAESALELVTVRVSLRHPGPALRLQGSPRPDQPLRSRRRACFAGRIHDVEVLAGPLPEGFELTGPTLVTLPEATLVVAPGWSGHADEAGTMILERTE